MAGNTSTIIVVMVAVCMVAVTVPAVIVASEDDGQYDITIEKESRSATIDWKSVEQAINDFEDAKNNGITAKYSGDCIKCTVNHDVDPKLFQKIIQNACVKAGVKCDYFESKDKIEEGDMAFEHPIWLYGVEP